MHQQAERFRAAVPDRLTDAVPEWLRAAARPRKAPVPWAEMARAGIAICVPMAAGILAGERALGLLIAMGGLLGIVVDNGGRYAARLRRVGSAACGGAVGIAIGSLIHDRGWVAVLALIVVAGVSAVLSAISDIGSVTGLQLMVYSSLGLGPIGALRPWWHTALGFVLGAVWAFLLTVPGLVRAPRAAEQRSVAAVYRALATQLRAIGSDRYPAARLGVTAALNGAYDTLLTARSTAGGRSTRLNRLLAVLNQANPVAEAAAALSVETGPAPPPAAAGALDRLASAVEDGSPPPTVPPLTATSPGALALRDALASAARVLSGNRAPAAVPPRPPVRARIAALAERLNGKLTWLFVVRLMVCVGVAGAATEVLPLERSYWVVLTVAIVLKPDLGSVFARAVQRGVGTIIGAVLGALIIAAVPYGLWLLLPFGVLAALLPYGRSRNFGLMAIFLTPLVVLLIDLLTRGGWQLAGARLLDTVLGCAIALVFGYALWPASWHAHLPGQFAETIKDVTGYMEEALVGAWAGQQAAQPSSDGATRLPARSRLRRNAYRALSDLRAEFERTMAEPQPVSRRATAWWPALVGLEAVMDAVTATAVAISRGAPAPSPAAVHRLTAALDRIADAVRTGVPPPAAGGLPSDEALKPVTEAVRAVLGVFGRQQSP